MNAKAACLVDIPLVAPDGQVIKGKLTAALNIWSMVLGAEEEREEVFKAGICPVLHVLLERGDVEERHAAMGCLAVLAQSEKHVAEVVTNRAMRCREAFWRLRLLADGHGEVMPASPLNVICQVRKLRWIVVIGASAALLMCDHARGKLPAVQLLRLCAARQDFSAKVADVALPALVEVLKSDGLPGWGQMRQVTKGARTHAAHTLKLLLENVEGEVPEIRQARRAAVLQLGAVAPLAAMVASAPRLPPPALMPAPPPVMTKKKGKDARKHARKGETPLGARDAAATVASACLRYLSLVPEFVDEFMRKNTAARALHSLVVRLSHPPCLSFFTGTGTLPGIIRGLHTCGEEQAAFLTGILWETTAEAHVAEAAVAAGAVVALLHVISKNLAGCKIGKARKSSKAAKGGDKKDGRGSRATSPKRDGKDGKDGKGGKGGKGKGSGPAGEPVNFPDAAVCNATGALQHLTFLDDAKHQVALHGGVPILSAALKISNPQTYENASGALWNVGLDVRNSLMLQAAGAPTFLARPVPPTWLTRGDELPGGSDSDDSDAAEEIACSSHSWCEHCMRARVCECVYLGCTICAPSSNRHSSTSLIIVIIKITAGTYGIRNGFISLF
ncbi:hypothetical protein VOLCADRAFT_94450 [Volvox carteri f. nagariensis]|uniref:Uncharacterized protein n=1 Tax=Volvox carteri f. nagariensis TaxID=3068 RepID=D8U4U3_VOLCA|nr:uncharacterized protein VOLCADRAFT_94450 [Volvox carteri f. nagariensis]EFJ45247.1 hypothetical protein VOLCADRAFT_94450 [Volvox carteri f. nagariensis]|eukprot:XP_002953623.1 hypothetical protein VOLCADRAFT_94450 [Volvox carteri f. nagariensis]